MAIANARAVRWQELGVASDLEIAYQMQLDEALAASLLSASPGDRQTVAGNSRMPLSAASGDNQLFGRRCRDQQTPAGSQSADEHKIQATLKLGQMQLMEPERGRQQLQQWREAKNGAAAMREQLKRSSHVASYDKDLEEEDDALEVPEQKISSQKSVVIHFKALVVPDLENSGLFHMSVGSVVLDQNGRTLLELRRYLGTGKSGKVAAYFEALLDALNATVGIGISAVRANSDSVTVRKLLVGAWELRSKKLGDLHQQLMVHVGKLAKFTVNVKKTGRAKLIVDRLASEALHSRMKVENCVICMEDKLRNEMMRLKLCEHSFCSTCIAQHAEVKLKSCQIPIPCPHVGCGANLTVEECKVLLCKESINLLHKRLREAEIPEANRLYCPYKMCSALMDSRGLGFSSDSHTGCAKCTTCSRLFCAECRVPWHVGMSCRDYQMSPHKRDAEDAKLYSLARELDWKRCKMCRRMIELLEGCNHMTCRCGYEFCYICEAEWKDKKQTCSCELFDAEYSEEDIESDWETEDEEFDAYGLTFYDSDSEGFDMFEYDIFSGTSTSNHWQQGITPGRFYKTKMCMFWSSGDCRKGEQCNFAHGAEELRELS